MSPTLSPNDVVIFAQKEKYAANEVVLVKFRGREVIKRIGSIKGDRCTIVGDNSLNSYDSRHYGTISQSAILGVVMMKLPVAIEPPRLHNKFALIISRSFAVLYMTLAVVHLFRIDLLIPYVASRLGLSIYAASLLVVLVVVSEVFAIPYLLRMKLSWLGHVVSGGMVVAAPALWVFMVFKSEIAEFSIAGEIATPLGGGITYPLSIVWLLAAVAMVASLRYFSLFDKKRGKK